MRGSYTEDVLLFLSLRLTLLEFSNLLQHPRTDITRCARNMNIIHTFQPLLGLFRFPFLSRPPLCFLGSIPLLTPYFYASDAQISVKLLNGIQECAIVARQEDMCRVLRMECETRRDLDGGLLLRRCLWHGKHRVVSYTQAVFTSEVDWGMKAEEESLAGRGDGCGET